MPDSRNIDHNTASPERVARSFLSSKKKKIKNKDGETVEIYEYSDAEIKKRHTEKSEKVEKVRKGIEGLKKQLKKDLSDPDKKEVALAVALIDQTYERVGNDESAGNGHFGVTGWKKKHVSFSGNKATIKYTGKSGVDQVKEITDPSIVKILKEKCKDKGKEDCVLADTSASKVNSYLKEFGITAKDIRGYHANNEMLENLKRGRKGKLPSDKKEKEKVLKEEFKKALEQTAEKVGHEASTLRSQYLVPHLEETYMKDGTVITTLKKASAHRVASRYMEKEAGIRDLWNSFVYTPISSLLKRAPEFLSGPVDDVIDDIFREVAPIVSEEVQKQIIEITFKEFSSNFFAGASDRTQERYPQVTGKILYPKFRCSGDCNWADQGYLMGYNNPNLWGTNKIKDKKVRNTVLKAIVDQEEDDLSENVVLSKLYDVWSAINPVNLVKMTIQLVKKYGWKIGFGIALVQAIETFVIPSVVGALGFGPGAVALSSQLPITEIVLPIVATRLGVVIGDPPVITEEIDEWLEQNPEVKLGLNRDLI